MFLNVETLQFCSVGVHDEARKFVRRVRGWLSPTKFPAVWRVEIVSLDFQHFRVNEVLRIIWEQCPNLEEVTFDCAEDDESELMEDGIFIGPDGES